jgi:hypothetical protein
MRRIQAKMGTAKAAKRGRKKSNPMQPGPMDASIMVCKECGCPEFEAIYSAVWWSEDHPQNATKEEMFQMKLSAYQCKKCGYKDAILPPGFELLRAQMKALRNPMRIVEKPE